MADPTFTPDQFKEAQDRLGLSDAQAARMLGLADKYQVRRLKVRDPSKPSHRPVRPPTARLLQAYLDGYRPPDWPAVTDDQDAD